MDGGPSSEHDGNESEPSEEEKLGPKPAPSALRKCGDERHIDRKYDVEPELSWERYGGRDSAPLDRLRTFTGVVDRVELKQSVVDPPIFGEDPAEARIDGEDREGEPVGRDDPQETSAHIRHDARMRRPEHPMGDERAVYDKAGDDEEHRDPDVVCEEPPVPVVVAGTAPEHDAVSNDDVENGQATDRVDQRKPAMTRRERRPARNRQGRGSVPPERRLPCRG